MSEKNNLLGIMKVGLLIRRQSTKTPIASIVVLIILLLLTYMSFSIMNIFLTFLIFKKNFFKLLLEGFSNFQEICNAASRDTADKKSLIG